MVATARDLLHALPPFAMIPARCAGIFTRGRLIVIHFAILGSLYGVVFIAAVREHVIYLPTGEGIFQNPPFLAHLICGACSIWLPLAVAERIANITDSALDDAILVEFVRLLQISKTKAALFSVGFLIGLASLADTVAMSAAPTIDIYDSVHHPLTFLSYLFVRTYLYLVCYPFMICSTIVTVYYLFRALRSSTAAYQPFHDDEMGGFQKYFQAVDRPVYLLQCLTVLVGAMNYLGWGGMLKVPLIFSIAAPVIVSGLAFILLFEFQNLLKFKRNQEIRAIRRQQTDLYLEAKRLASGSPAEGLELLKRIEVLDALVEAIRRGRPGGWGKYLLNIAAFIASQIAKPLASLIANHLRFN